MGFVLQAAIYRFAKDLRRIHIGHRELAVSDLVRKKISVMIEVDSSLLQYKNGGYLGIWSKAAILLGDDKHLVQIIPRANYWTVHITIR